MSRLKRKVERLRKKLEKLAPPPRLPPSVDIRSLTPDQFDRLEALLVLACGPGARSEPDLSQLTDPERRELYALMDAATSDRQQPSH